MRPIYYAINAILENLISLHRSSLVYTLPIQIRLGHKYGKLQKMNIFRMPQY